MFDFDSSNLFQQRLLKFVGFSGITHVAVLTTLALTPPNTLPFGTADGNGGGNGMMVVELVSDYSGSAAPKPDEKTSNATPPIPQQETLPVAPRVTTAESSKDSIQSMDEGEILVPTKSKNKTSTNTKSAKTKKPTQLPPKLVKTKLIESKPETPSLLDDASDSNKGDVAIEDALKATRNLKDPALEPNDEIEKTEADLSAQLNEEILDAEETPEIPEEAEPLITQMPEPADADQEPISPTKEMKISKSKTESSVAPNPIDPSEQKIAPTKVANEPIVKNLEESQKSLQPVTQLPAQQVAANPQPTSKSGAPPARGPIGNQSGYGNGSGTGLPQGVQIRDASELTPQPGNRPPYYPQQDRMLGRQGVTVIVGKVLANGLIGHAYVESKSGSPLMDASALQAFRKWRFMPGQDGYVRQPFQFQLTGQTEIKSSRLRRR